MARKKKTDGIEVDVINVDLQTIPVVEMESGWEIISEHPIDSMEAMSLKKITYNGAPGSRIRVRTESVNGEMYNATVWDVMCKGIAKADSLIGHEFGGHEICCVRVQKFIGHSCTATLEFEMHRYDSSVSQG